MRKGIILIGPRTVQVMREGVRAFNRTWPCSELRETRSYWFEFDAYRDLIETDVPESDDGAAAVALAADCEAFAFDGITPKWESER